MPSPAHLALRFLVTKSNSSRRVWAEIGGSLLGIRTEERRPPTSSCVEVEAAEEVGDAEEVRVQADGGEA